MALTLSVGMFSLSVQARVWEFDASRLGGDISDADIALFNQGGQLPGTYQVEVLLNSEQVDSREVVFHLREDARGTPVLQPCLSRTQLSRYGIKTEDYPGLSGKGPDVDKDCADIHVIPDARAEFNFGAQQLMLSVPQIALRPEVKGIAPRELWDEGIPAILMNYRAGTSRIESRIGSGSVNASQYMQLEPGANWGPWRLRNSTTWQKSRGHSGRWQTPYTYLERGLYDMQSRLTLGERFTPSEIFDSVPFRGVMLGSDENMQPSSLRAFSPVVRGIARTQARVEVKQNGYTIYNATVAPGPFALRDFAAGGSGGDLQVTVWEADGSTQEFNIPYQTPAIALQEGHRVYNLMAGQYRASDNAVDAAPVAQATVMYGLPWSLTLYGGLQGAKHYQATTAGLGMSLGSWGAVSLDGTHGRGQKKEHESETGGFGRLRYSKSVAATNTSFTLSTTRYDSSGFTTLSEVLDSYRQGSPAGRDAKRRSETTLTLGQSLGGWGSFTLSGSRNSYGNGQGGTESFSAGYGVGIRGVSLSLSATQNRTRNRGDKWQDNRLVNVMVSVPLERWLGGSTRATYQTTASSSGGNTQQVGLSGQAYDRQLRWNVNQRQRSGAISADRNDSDLNLGWSGGYGQLNGRYGYSSSYRLMGLDASGGVAIARSGVIAAQTMNETVALVEAPGASGVQVRGWPGVKTDFRGYTTQSGLQPYRKNIVSLNPARLSADAEIKQTDVTVVPTQGAIIPATFITHIGGRALVTLTRPDGKPLPFGTLVTSEKQTSSSSGITGEGGQVYLSGLDGKGAMVARWGEAQQCRADYRLPEKQGPAGLYLLEAVCR
ncbi:fimbria/pilus outer membrane usher protein [Enterobacter sp. Cy-643]|uniref:fimbria/pilus outer membrane usher protein n=1 Tax=Enterobacter sp. Cy-643 TaxID=2608346 RepID=UPI00336ACA65